jgi:hypothetical protein
MECGSDPLSGECELRAFVFGLLSQAHTVEEVYLKETI